MMSSNVDHASSELEDESYCSVENGDSTSPHTAEEHPSSPGRDDKIVDLIHGNDLLVREVASLRSDKASLAGKVQELEKQLKVDIQKVETLLNEKDRVEERRSEILLEVSNLKNEVSVLKACQSGLEYDKQSLLSEKEKLEAALLKSETDLAETARSLEEAKSNASETKLKISALESEVSKLAGDEKRLTAENDALVADNREKDLQTETLKVQTADLEQKRERLISDIRSAVEESTKAKQTIEKLSSEEARLKEENTDLERAVATANKKSADLEIQNETLLSRLKGLEADILNLQMELKSAVSDHEIASQNLAKEQEYKSALKEELAVAHSEKSHLQESLYSALALAQKYQEIASKEQSQISMLQDQVSALLREKLWIEESKIAIEVEVKNLSVKSAEVLKNAQEQIADWKRKVEILEGVLEKVSDESMSNEKKAWQLLSELESIKGILEQKLRVNRYAISVAAASTGAFAVLGMVVYLRARK